MSSFLRCLALFAALGVAAALVHGIFWLVIIAVILLIQGVYLAEVHQHAHRKPSRRS